MLRKLLTIVLPLALPFIVYGLYLVYARYVARKRGEGDLPGWARAPWAWIVGSGVVLMAATLIAYRLFTASPIEGTYVPPHLEDGRVVPGTVRPE